MSKVRNGPLLAGLVALSAASLLYEIALTRLYSVAEFYHFAFMIISLAMLGTGASGTVLALLPGRVRGRWRPMAYLLALAQGLSIVGAYLLMNHLPFDSYALLVDPKQVLLLLSHYVLLAVPLFCSGMILGLLLSRPEANVGGLYAASLAGGSLGCILAILLPRQLGGEGTLLFAGALSCFSALCYVTSGRLRIWVLEGGVSLGLGAIMVAQAVIVPPLMALRLSPYKALSYAMQYPGADAVYSAWNAYSRVDVVRSEGIRSLPGLSYRYQGDLPSQSGLFSDADNLSPIVGKSGSEGDWTSYMPTALAYRLWPGADVLVLDPQGGLEVEVALEQGAAHVTAAMPNHLIVEACGSVYTQAGVSVVTEQPRSHVRATPRRYEIVVLPLIESYHPVQSGAYSLSEDYALTVDAFEDYVQVLARDGVLVATRWLQMPPSESLRLYVLAVDAVERTGGDAETQIVALRGYSTMTLLVKRTPFSSEELAAVRAFAADRAYDLVAAPGLDPGEANRYSVLAEPLYYDAFRGYLSAPDRGAWLSDYAYDVTPPTDDHPFFGHYFRASQVREVLAGLGRTWQPFGGAGYLALLVIGLVALGASAIIIFLPLVVARHRARSERALQRERVPARLPVRRLAYFGLIGLGYMLIEIPLIQRFIVFVGQPAYALTAILGGLLLWSGVGSALSLRLTNRRALAGAVLLAVAYLWLLPVFFAALLGLSQTARLFLSVAMVAPLGLFMGMPFAQGMRLLRAEAEGHVAWAWGVNGAASVVGSVGASLLALASGFRWVLLAGAACYSAAWVAAGGGAVLWDWLRSRTRGTKVT